MVNRELKYTLAALAALLLLKGAVVVFPLDSTAKVWGNELVSTMSNRGLNREAREALTAGYYEGLLNEGSRLSTMNRFVLDNRRPTWEDNSRPESRSTGDFLYYEHIPNASTPDYQDERFRYVLTTNSAGLADKEYPLAKADGTRRIAILGDSITRGLGAPANENFESLLEIALNERHTTESISRYEVLNFAVTGYHITQIMEATKVKATQFDPDVYVIALSDLSVYRRWHGHIAALVYSGVDLKYDYLRGLISETKLTPSDSIGVFDARLARYRIPTIRWVIEEIQDHVAHVGAELVVILVPSSEDPEVLREAFLGVPEILAELGVPFVDLLDTFVDEEQRIAVRVADGDRHPNAYGHRLLSENLYQRIMQNSVVKKTLLNTTE